MRLAGAQRGRKTAGELDVVRSGFSGRTSRLEDDFPGIYPRVAVEARPGRQEEHVRHERVEGDLSSL